MHLNNAIVFVSGMKRSVSFYRDVLGLPLRFEAPGWPEFANDGATLALHLEKRPDHANADDNPKDEAPGSCRPGLGVCEWPRGLKPVAPPGVAPRCTRLVG